MNDKGQNALLDMSSGKEVLSLLPKQQITNPNSNTILPLSIWFHILVAYLQILQVQFTPINNIPFFLQLFSFFLAQKTILMHNLYAHPFYFHVEAQLLAVGRLEGCLLFVGYGCC